MVEPRSQSHYKAEVGEEDLRQPEKRRKQDVAQEGEVAGIGVSKSQERHQR